MLTFEPDSLSIPSTGMVEEKLILCSCLLTITCVCTYTPGPHTKNTYINVIKIDESHDGYYEGNYKHAKVYKRSHFGKNHHRWHFKDSSVRRIREHLFHEMKAILIAKT